MLPQDETSTEDMATSQAMNGELPVTPVNGYIPPAPMMTAASVTPPPSTNGTHGSTTSYQVSVPAAPQVTVPAAPAVDTSGDYTAYVLNVDVPWPPPIFARPSMKPEERFYLENRWYSQWSFYDKKANQSKKSYLRLQQIIVIGSVIVPVLVAFGPNLTTIIPTTISPLLVRFVIDVITVVISTAVAVAAAWEGLHKNGDAWTTYRRAAEEMQQEKFTFDVRTGRYANNTDAFARFVERCEEIMAQQNGRFIQTIEKQQAQAAEQNQDILTKYREKEEATTITVSSPTGAGSTVSVETTPAPAPVVVAAVEDSSAG